MDREMEIVNPLEFPGWDDLILSNPAGSFFHSTNWARVLSETYGYRPRFFAIFMNGGLETMVPVLEIDSVITGKRGVSLPFSDYSDPFFGSIEQYRHCVQDIVECGKRSGWETIEIRGGICPWREEGASSEFYGHRLNLERPEEELFANLRKNMQRNIKKSLNLGVNVVFLNSMDAVSEFYRLNCITRKAHGIPPQPMEFFRKVHEHILSRNQGVVALASYKGSYVAGCVYFHFGRKAIYKYGASDLEGKTSRANNLVMWEAIKWYSQKGYAQLCFGRTEFENSGLRDYKLGYGTEEYVLQYHKYDIQRCRVVTNEDSGTPIWRKAYRFLPISISKIIGNVSYRHIG